MPHDLMKHVIGLNGKWFKYTCDKCVVSNIWFNKEKSIVEIWGPIDNLSAANFAIQTRINVIKDRFSFMDEEDDVKMWRNDDYEEMLFNEIVINDNFIGSQLNINHIRILIGRHGNGFKRITRESGVSFIWYNSVAQSIQIWGYKSDIEKAKAIILDRINTIFTNTLVDIALVDDAIRDPNLT
jgi:hypothetical protein